MDCTVISDFLSSNSHSMEWILNRGVPIYRYISYQWPIEIFKGISNKPILRCKPIRYSDITGACAGARV